MIEKLENKKTLLFRIGACVVLAGLVVAGTIYGVHYTAKHYTATEISMEDLPESIKAEAEEDVQEGGAYFYRESEDAETAYVALSFGKQLDMDMNVTITDIEDGLYFSIAPIETPHDEEVIYKLYETDAPSINTDKNILKNPRLIKGAVGINVGYVVPTETGYYIEPLENDSEYNRLYTAADGVKMEQGIYRYTCQLTQDGAEVLSASAIDQYSKEGYVSGIDPDSGTVNVVLVGEEKIAYEMRYDTNNKEVASVLENMNELGTNATGNFIFHYEDSLKALKIDKCQTISSSTEIELSVNAEIENEGTEQ